MKNDNWIFLIIAGAILLILFGPGGLFSAYEFSKVTARNCVNDGANNLVCNRITSSAWDSQEVEGTNFAIRSDISRSWMSNKNTAYVTQLDGYAGWMHESLASGSCNGVYPYCATYGVYANTPAESFLKSAGATQKYNWCTKPNCLTYTGLPTTIFSKITPGRNCIVSINTGWGLVKVWGNVSINDVDPSCVVNTTDFSSSDFKMIEAFYNVSINRYKPYGTFVSITFDFDDTIPKPRICVEDDVIVKNCSESVKCVNNSLVMIQTICPTTQNITNTTQIINNQSNVSSIVYCAQDLKLCNDGSYVNRVSPSCEFKDCPIFINNTQSVPETSVNTENVKNNNIIWISILLALLLIYLFIKRRK